MVMAAALALMPLAATAESPPWPSRPVKLIVSWPPGGSADSVARLVSDRLARRLGQPVIVENRPGAGGRIGTLSVVRADPDGYTLLLGAPSELTIAAATVKSLPYDPLKDLQPVAQVVSGAYMLIASTAFAPNTVAEIVAFAKANPTGVNYASYGNNTTNHLYGEQFNAVTGIKSLHVAYKGGSPAWNDLMAGQVQYMFENAALAMPFVRSGKVKAIAVLAPERLPLAPETPTMKELGYPGMGVRSWLGIFAPSKTPRAVVERLHAEITAVLADPELARTLDERGMPAGRSTLDEFAALMQSETNGWKGLVAKLGLKLE